ncbi:MAG TPA: glycosyltransferase [Candidatus Woesebacteria bacterium]|nr:glycosyltransferase [Candidatus Woesebacteria bacterium]
MKIALVHDFIKEFGGAERVLRVLADMFPDAPIYTAFRVKGSSCDKKFADRKIVESKYGWLLKRGNLYSPLRFLAPWVWKSLDLSGYDMVITSCSSYFARGFKVRPETKVVAYCHTPPRFLYGFEMSINLMKYWPVRVYAVVVNHFLRIFDLSSSERVNKWLVNSKNVQQRVWKYYRKDSVVVYPPVEVEKLIEVSKGVEKEDYFLIVSRLVGAKGLVEAAKAARHLKFPLKIVGEAVGFSQVENQLKSIEGVELLGAVDDDRLKQLYARAKGFIALAKEEDFGITPVEAMASGTPVIAFKGGGFKETVVDGETGVFVEGTDVKTLEEAIRRFNKVKWEKNRLVDRARLFSKEKFIKRIKEEIKKVNA